MSLSNPVSLAVNGTLMRGLELNPNLLSVGAAFRREDTTVPLYRLFSIGDRHPEGMPSRRFQKGIGERS